MVGGCGLSLSRQPELGGVAGASVAAAKGVACATKPPNKRMKQTKRGWSWGRVRVDGLFRGSV